MVLVEDAAVVEVILEALEGTAMAMSSVMIRFWL